MGKNEIIKHILSELQRQQSLLLNVQNEKFPQWSNREKYVFNGEYQGQNVREILPNEIIIEFDEIGKNPIDIIQNEFPSRFQDTVNDLYMFSWSIVEDPDKKNTQWERLETDDNDVVRTLIESKLLEEDTYAIAVRSGDLVGSTKMTNIWVMKSKNDDENIFSEESKEADIVESDIVSFRLSDKGKERKLNVILKKLYDKEILWGFEKDDDTTTIQTKTIMTENTRDYIQHNLSYNKIFCVQTETLLTSSATPTTIRELEETRHHIPFRIPTTPSLPSQQDHLCFWFFPTTSLTNQTLHIVSGKWGEFKSDDQNISLNVQSKPYQLILGPAADIIYDCTAYYPEFFGGLSKYLWSATYKGKSIFSYYITLEHNTTEKTMTILDFQPDVSSKSLPFFVPND